MPMYDTFNKLPKISKSSVIRAKNTYEELLKLTKIVTNSYDKMHLSSISSDELFSDEFGYTIDASINFIESELSLEEGVFNILYDAYLNKTPFEELIKTLQTNKLIREIEE